MIEKYDEVFLEVFDIKKDELEELKYNSMGSVDIKIISELYDFGNNSSRDVFDIANIPLA